MINFIDDNCINKDPSYKNKFWKLWIFSFLQENDVVLNITWKIKILKLIEYEFSITFIF